MKKILLVNDCRFESMVMKDMLSSLNYDVTIANEYDAMAKVDSIMPDIVIANLIMQNIGGDALLGKIKKNNKDIICMLSSCNSISHDDFNQSDISEIIHTPIYKDELKNLLDQCVNKDKGPDCKNDTVSYCSFCGHKLLDDRNKEIHFCSYCGHKLLR